MHVQVCESCESSGFPNFGEEGKDCFGPFFKDGGIGFAFRWRRDC